MKDVGTCGGELKSVLVDGFADVGPCAVCPACVGKLGCCPD